MREKDNTYLDSTEDTEIEFLGEVSCIRLIVCMCACAITCMCIFIHARRALMRGEHKCSLIWTLLYFHFHFESMHFFLVRVAVLSLGKKNKFFFICRERSDTGGASWWPRRQTCRMFLETESAERAPILLK